MIDVLGSNVRSPVRYVLPEESCQCRRSWLSRSPRSWALAGSSASSHVAFRARWLCFLLSGAAWKRRRNAKRFFTSLPALPAHQGGCDDDDDDDEEDEDGLGFSVAPWADKCDARPIYVVSDFYGTGAKLLLRSAWAQFDSSEPVNLTLRPKVRSEEDVDLVLEEVSESDALLVYTVASRQLSNYIDDECKKRGLQCVNVLEAMLQKMESCFNQARLESCFSQDHHEPSKQPALEEPAVFAVSCGSGHCTFHLVCAALRLFPTCGVRKITVCPEMRTLEEVRLLIKQAKDARALVVFTFASPGMSRFLRQQCELEGVRYADIFQPLLVTMELYLQHPFFGISGGLGSNALHDAELRWEVRATTTDGSDFEW